MAFMPSFWTTTLLVLAFFFAYYVYEPPYRGLYPDLLPERVYCRAQSVQHLMRGVALGGALVGGGFLFDVWKPFPFLIAALVTTTACGAAIALLRESPTGSRVFEGVRAYVAAVGAGALGDRLGLARVIFLASWLYGGGLLLGG